ncbi:hypothetical protein JCM9140_600 [Halalkalibacter wakoensis JCM 9140]|uniref:Adenosylcobinamide kinase n=1 Tax=Halalkalibacter wakoensis JCM 9140 TaxID=1236970 RepID=W4PY46_9BACI|nr:bifunctional adenosylcobinamide kinase/adenosylcobinamide-phosphate guanylyltransferase [Halalkalibacter wakoensis]GAE24657.1 hypothetical protein JCM9140_600 [Halalkalibacter wakoensis JCM 9140]
MQLVIGGAFSGKRKIVRKMGKSSWLSAYNRDPLSKWDSIWEKDSLLVLEGWETWVAHEIEKNEKLANIRLSIREFLQQMKREEKRRDSEIILIVLEVGRGIVPIEKRDRLLRDLLGWIAQDAVEIADEVHYVWNGLHQKLK